MNRDNSKSAAMPHWSLDGFALGVRLALPLLPGMIAFALAVGTTAARKGFTLVESLMMNGIVYAGASQMVAMEIWPDRLTAASIAALALVTATVNARMLLMGAALRPWFGPLPAWQTYPLMYLTTDPGWLISMRYRAGGGNDAAIFLGSGVIIWLTWMASTTAGYLLGAVIANPRALGLDLVMPVFFAAMLLPLWSGKRRGVGWAVAAAVALAVDALGFGWWFIVAGALAGAVVEGFADEW